ncbi:MULTISPECIES: hypothetical protein [unclassified Crossiella]|uniref:hypothetical protein n=1 Tax=unclassified Crossiella TaxID=2620835 RepID=UPI001FFFDEBA|nr:MULTISPECIES: hypothetical protein [unclassified Crossiella]MCK2240165.1 hypothetical protein [Crossiella sp. S99.2]MCK2253383.1 hypothetical protein [Crossiella sp. S99.1]
MSIHHLTAPPTAPDIQPLLSDQAQLTIVLVVWVAVAVILAVVVARSCWRRKRADRRSRADDAGPFIRLMPPEPDTKAS